MSQKTDQNDVCQGCKQGWITHHAFKAFTDEGKPRFECQPKAVAKTDSVVAYLIGLRSDRLKAQKDLAELKRSRDADLQASKADLERAFAAKVRTEADKKTAESVETLRADQEKTRVQLVSDHAAKALDLQTQLAEVRGDNRILREEKTVIAAKLSESERSLALRQAENEELKSAYVRLTNEVKEVMDTGGQLAVQIVRLNDSLEACGTRAVEPSTIVVPFVPPLAPKANVVAMPMAARSSPAPVVLPAAEVVLDDPPSAPDASASADGEDEGDDADDIGDDDVIAQAEVTSDGDDDVSSEEDDASSDENEIEECRVCDKPATHGFTFKTKDGAQERLTTCGPKKHADELLQYLQEQAMPDATGVLKSIPQKPGQLVTLLKEHPINPNP